MSLIWPRTGICRRLDWVSGRNRTDEWQQVMEWAQDEGVGGWGCGGVEGARHLQRECASEWRQLHRVLNCAWAHEKGRQGC